MKLRCKPGDLALVVRGTQTGKMLTCERLENPPARFSLEHSPIWKVDRDMPWGRTLEDARWIPYAPDDALMPIRPEPDDVDTRITQDVPAENTI